MANRRLNQFSYSFEPAPVTICAKISFGAAGAPTIVRARGVTSITRTGAGAFTIVLDDTYFSMLSANVMFNTEGAAGAAPAAPSMYIIEDKTATLSARTLKVKLTSLAGAAADPASGEVMLLRLMLKNSSS